MIDPSTRRCPRTRAGALATGWVMAVTIAASACASSVRTGATVNTASTAGNAALAAPAPTGSSDPSASVGANTRSGGSSATSAPSAGALGSAASGASGGGGTGPGGLRWVGRVDATDPKAARFAWSGSGLVATVTGSTISVKLQTRGATTSTAYFQPVIDGKPGPRFEVQKGPAQRVVLASHLAAGTHTIELYRESEGMYGESVFLGFVDGTVTGAPPPSGRLIEVVGDSISAGYGNLRTVKHPPWENNCLFSLATESAYQSYGAQTARALGAEVSIIARSGWGMSRDLAGSKSGLIPLVYGNAVGTDDKTSWGFEQKPNAVIVNLGTNDVGRDKGSDPGQAYEDAYVAFVRTLRSHYSDAWILMTLGTMTGEPMLTTMRAHLANIGKTLNDPKVFTVDLGPQDAKSTGCDYHPNVAEDGRIAGILAAALRAKLGW